MPQEGCPSSWTNALRKIAELQKDKYPEAATAVKEDYYMDDNATGAISHEKIDELSSDMTNLLAAGGMATKGYTKSGRPPPPSVSEDGESVSVFGAKWFSELDEIQLVLGPLNFSKKRRGKKNDDEDSRKVPNKLTMRICAGKVAEIFDLIGFLCPITAGFKLDIHDLHSSYDWDIQLSEVDTKIWLENFDLMESLEGMRWPRAVIPQDAASRDIELIGAGDASEKMAAAACYIRFQRKDGSYSCQLLAAKSKIVSEDITLPRAELLAATLNTHVTEIIKRSLKRQNVVNTVYVLDSEIALHWITSTTKRLKPWVRNRVIEMSRFTKPLQWFQLESSLNPVDVATRKGAKGSDVDRDSDWYNGIRVWMNSPIEDVRHTVLKDVDDIKLKSEHMAEIKKEEMKAGTDLCDSQFHSMYELESTSAFHITLPNSKVSVNENLIGNISSVVKERLSFSKYLIDPNRFHFNKVVRIFAVTVKCAKKWLARMVGKKWLAKKGKTLSRFSSPTDINEKATRPMVRDTSTSANEALQNFTLLSDVEIQHSLNYFYRKATEELKSFVHPKLYENISVEKDDILYFTGRVSLENVNFKCDMTTAMIDLSTGTFIVPIIDKYSPLSFSIVNQVHWYDPDVKHCGVETTIRSIMNIAHILGVRDIAKIFRKQCARCRYLLKVTVDVEMGLLPKSRLCVAPPYYNTQVDLCGPFNAFSKHNKRTTLKVWMIAFVCSTTGSTNLKIMEGYDTTQFLLAFSRFACEVGYPKLLLADSGSQLVSGCENMVIDMTDLKGKLNREYGIDFDVCPVGGHNFHGKVERKIKTVKETISKTVHNERLSVLEWETLCAEIANSVNNLPVAIGNETDELENMDLITPNRLRLGRNNSRSPVGVLEVTDKVDRILQLNSNIFNTWWECWLTSAVPKLVPQPKWFKSDEDIKVGDIVIFSRSEGKAIAGAYRYGIVEEVMRGEDDRIRSATIKYKNNNEEITRTTCRAVRNLVIIHRVDELNIMEELGKAQFLSSS